MTFPDLGEGCVLCLLWGALWIWPCSGEAGHLAPSFPQGATQPFVLLLGRRRCHTCNHLSGQLRRWRYLDLSSKAVFFNTEWFLSIPTHPRDYWDNYHNVSLYFGCEDKALMSSEPSDDPSSSISGQEAAVGEESV